MQHPVRKFPLSLADHAARWASKAVRTLPDEPYMRLMFLLNMRRILHLRNPRTYSEKVQWIKLRTPVERYAPYVDKYEVRKYIAEKIGADYLVPIIGVWDSFDQIPLDALPERFVLKATHGSGFNFVCRSKSSLDVSSLRQTATTWLSTNFYKVGRERQYQHIRPRLIAEAYLVDGSGGLQDYKFTCINGVPRMLEVITGRDSESGMRENVYDHDWNLLPITPTGLPNTDEPIPKPALLDEMFTIAGTLSSEFEFVRVDLYYVDDRIYFGELTFTPGNGFMTFEPRSFDLELGRMIGMPGISATSLSN